MLRTMFLATLPLVWAASDRVLTSATTRPTPQSGNQSSPTSRSSDGWTDSVLSPERRRQLAGEQVNSDAWFKHMRAPSVESLNQILGNAMSNLARCRINYIFDQKKTAAARFVTACSPLNAVRSPRDRSNEHIDNLLKAFVYTVYLTNREYVDLLPRPKDQSLLDECLSTLQKTKMDDWKNLRHSVGKDDPATADQQTEYLSVVTGQYQPQKGDPMPLLVGDEANTLRIMAKPLEYVETEFIICGTVRISDYYNFKYRDARPTHYSFSVTTGNAEWQGVHIEDAYLSRAGSDDLVKAITKKDNSHILARLKVTILRERLDRSNVPLEILDWQFYRAGEWTVWRSQIR
jgi:hypothetical protein